VAGGPQPARGGRGCQDPVEYPTLATLADALEASNLERERCRPGWAALPAAEIKPDGSHLTVHHVAKDRSGLTS
jgi:hypothetical protein